MQSLHLVRSLNSLNLLQRSSVNNLSIKNSVWSHCAFSTSSSITRHGHSHNGVECNHTHNEHEHNHPLEVGPATVKGETSSGKSQKQIDLTDKEKHYCVDLVKKYDYEHYLSTLFLSSSVRDAVFAFRALNVEVSQIRDSVSNKNIGQMRVQWWKDTISSAIKGNPAAVPIAKNIAVAAQKHKFTTRWVSRLIEEREKILDDKPFRTLDEVEKYGEGASSALLYLTLECMNIRDIHADHAASHIGKAEAIVTLLRAVPFNARNKRVYLPMQLLAKHNVSQESILRGEPTKELHEVAYELASAAHVHIQTARALLQDLPPGATKALLPAVSCGSFLEKIQKRDFNLFDPELHHRNALLPFTLLKHAFKKTY